MKKKPSFTIGICGHKDIISPAKDILSALKSFWAEILSQEKLHSIMLLDSLAVGSDQYVLESKPDLIPYTAVLPFASEDYEKDFESPEAKQTYREYLNEASSIVIAGDERGNYVLASEYLLEHSDMILALWDCVIPEGTPAPGGSCDTITKALAKGLPVIVIPIRRKKTYSNVKQDMFPEERVPLKMKQDFSFERFSTRQINDEQK